MPRTSEPLEARPPLKRDPSIPSALWELPQRVVRLARQKDFDQRDLAEAAGLSQSTISKTLNYRNLRRFDARTALKLALALDTTVGFLIAGEGELFPSRQQLAPADTPQPPSGMRESEPKIKVNQ